MRQLEKRVVVNVFQLTLYAEEKYGMENNPWHKQVWRPYMMEYLMDGMCTFERTDNPDNILEEQINDFLLDYPELNGSVTFYFDD